VSTLSAAYSASAWGGFGEAVATAAAALAGLLFIAISINLKEILDIPGLPSRAAATLILFGTALLAAVLVVVPGQARVALGLELVATGLVLGGAQVYLDLSTERGEEETLARRMIGRIFPAYISCGCLVVGGATLAAQAGGGLYWLVPSVIAAIAFGLANVWVLLVEILR
jgi:hypothetical protein